MTSHLYYSLRLKEGQRSPKLTLAFDHLFSKRQLIVHREEAERRRDWALLLTISGTKTARTGIYDLLKEGVLWWPTSALGWNFQGLQLGRNISLRMAPQSLKLESAPKYDPHVLGQQISNIYEGLDLFLHVILGIYYLENSKNLINLADWNLSDWYIRQPEHNIKEKDRPEVRILAMSWQMDILEFKNI